MTATPSAWETLRRDRRFRFAATGLSFLMLLAAIGPWLYRVSPTALDSLQAGAAPSRSHLLGTDESGRDVLSRLLNGGRITLTVSVASVGIALLFGIVIGGLAGVRRGFVDTVLMRLTDAALAIPTLFIVLTAITFIGPSTGALILSIALTAWMTLARLIRADLLVVRELPFVEASTALGAPSHRVFTRHLWPHLVPTILTAATIGMSSAILMESALSYLGLGVQPPTASWGAMLSSAQSYLYTYPWLAAYPGALIVVTVFSINLLGDAIRDASSPRRTRVA